MLGFPDETPEDMADTINLVVILRKEGMQKFSIFPVIVYPGTELAKRFSINNFDSSIYESYPKEINKSVDFGEKCIAIYSTIPRTDINHFFSHLEIIELVKMAYNKILKMEFITAEEILSIKIRK